MLPASPSLWSPDLAAPAPALARDCAADVVVVGAGIAGVTTAYHLQKRGLNVLLLDAGPPGGGMTQRTTAHIANAVDDGWRKLVPRIGEDAARTVAAAYRSATTQIAGIQRDEGIACDFTAVDGYLIGGPADFDTLTAEKTAAAAAGITGVDWLRASPFPGDPTAMGLTFPGQARLHPLKYLNGLMRCLRDRGGRLHSAQVVSVAPGTPGAPGHVEAAAGPVATARHGIVLANNVQLAASRTPPQTLHTSYTLAAEAPAGAAPDAVMWDLDRPYHYIRLQPASADTTWVIVGGADHAANHPADAGARFAQIEAWARARFPGIGAIAARWAGNIKQTEDNLGFLGRRSAAENLFIIDGDGGLGFTHATVGALIIQDQITGRDSPWQAVFDPARYGLGRHPLCPRTPEG